MKKMKMNMYLVRKFIPSDYQENRELIQEYGKTRGSAAREKLIVENMGLVKSVAAHFAGKNNLDDLISAGYIGLIKAVDKFDYRKKNQFATYAVWWITQAVYRERLKDSVMPLPYRKAESLVKIEKEKEIHYKNHGTQLTTEEAITLSGVKPEDVYLPGRIVSTSSIPEEARGKSRQMVQTKGELAIDMMLADPDSTKPYENLEATFWLDSLLNDLVARGSLTQKQKSLPIRAHDYLPTQKKEHLAEMAQEQGVSDSTIKNWIKNWEKIMKREVA